MRLPIAKTLIEQSATKIFLPNPLAKEEYYGRVIYLTLLMKFEKFSLDITKIQSKPKKSTQKYQIK